MEYNSAIKSNKRDRGNNLDESPENYAEFKKVNSQKVTYYKFYLYNILEMTKL